MDDDKENDVTYVMHGRCINTLITRYYIIFFGVSSDWFGYCTNIPAMKRTYVALVVYKNVVVFIR